MKKETEVLYIDKLWRKMHRSLEAYIKTEATADLHHFRVQVKKLRAFITLAESDTKNAKLKHIFKPVKLLYSKAGEIRTADLNLEITSQQSPKAELIAKQHARRKEAIKAFKPFARKKLGQLAGIKNRLYKKLKGINDVRINLFYSENLKQLAEGLQTVNFDESLHTSRKQAKVLLYDYKLVSPVLKVDFNKAYLDKLQHVIGEWHDNEDAKALLKKEQLPAAGINKIDQKLRSRIKRVASDVYNRASTVTEMPLPQLS